MYIQRYMYTSILSLHIYCVLFIYEVAVVYHLSEYPHLLQRAFGSPCNPNHLVLFLPYSEQTRNCFSIS